MDNKLFGSDLLINWIDGQDPLNVMVYRNSLFLAKFYCFPEYFKEVAFFLDFLSISILFILKIDLIGTLVYIQSLQI